MNAQDITPLAYLSGGEIYQVHVDHLGTPQVLTDDTSAIAWEAHYWPFGDAITTGILTFNLRFPGQYHDAETGLHYNWHRYYDPQTGRYLTSVPIGLVGGLNPYLYAEANPLFFTDPEGLMAPQLIGGGAGLVVGFLASYINGASIDEALVVGIQSGAAGFISAGGSLLMGFSVSTTANLYASAFTCEGLTIKSAKEAVVAGGYSVIGGGIGGAAGRIIRPVRMVEKRPGVIMRGLNRFIGAKPKMVDANTQSRTNVSAAIGIASESAISVYFSGIEGDVK
ncbi:RHS repeat domain-containing protein [Halomonas sp. C05BenzN]|uniref:RHS repeat domain-containing protein n=1 Tax=Halomonas sp. C05BenzN TaxID=3411041 RepID=UPI003B932B1C